MAKVKWNTNKHGYRVEIKDGQVFVNTRLVAEAAIDIVEGTDELRKRLRDSRGVDRAREHLAKVLEALPQLPLKDHANPNDAKACAAFARGLLAGTKRETIPYPSDPSIPPIPPESSRSYRAGYALGEHLTVLLNVLDIPAEVNDDPPPKTLKPKKKPMKKSNASTRR